MKQQLTSYFDVILRFHRPDGLAADMAGTTSIFSTEKNFIVMLEAGKTFERPGDTQR
jgi:hypothetical protein